MWKPQVWAGFGTGLVMTAAGLLFNAKWLLLVAAICYGVAIVGWARNRRRLSKRGREISSNSEPPYTGPTTGVRVTNCGGATFGGLGAHNVDRGVVVEDSPDLNIGEVHATAAPDSQYAKTGRTAGVHVMPGGTNASIKNVRIMGFHDGIVTEADGTSVEGGEIQGSVPPKGEKKKD